MPSTTAAKNRQTPGVDITEIASIPSIVGTETAIPIFIGYTEAAVNPSDGKPLHLQAVPISSLADYISCFGAGFAVQGVVRQASLAGKQDFQASSMSVASGAALPTATPNAYALANPATGEALVPAFNLYAAMQLFFANGGGNCHVVSVGNYRGEAASAPDATPVSIKQADLMAGLAVANTVTRATMLVVPDACLMAPEVTTTTTPATATAAAVTTTTTSYPGYGEVACAMLRQSQALQDRVAILDLPGALDPATWSADGMQAQAEAFYAAIAPAQDCFSYGAAYGPALESSLSGANKVLYNSLSGSADSRALMNNLLTSQALALYPPALAGQTSTYSDTFIGVAARIAAAYPLAPAPVPAGFGVPAGVTATIPAPAAPAGSNTGPSSAAAAQPWLVALPNSAQYSPPTDDAGVLALNQYLVNALPLLAQILQRLARQLGAVPPSGAMAGVWTQNDANRGVWNAPANIALNGVASPKVLLSDEQQANYNVPLNGNAIDILRAFPGRGTVVWGARTLDGNSLDYRYIQVRRTLIYIEQSIKVALQQFVFAPNNGGTWASVTAAISNFLTQFWQQGGLMGDKASDAFTVHCGVPTTMSSLDVLNGYMIVSVTVQLIHPGEFIELTFTQTMQGT